MENITHYLFSPIVHFLAFDGIRRQHGFSYWKNIGGPQQRRQAKVAYLHFFLHVKYMILLTAVPLIMSICCLGKL